MPQTIPNLILNHRLRRGVLPVAGTETLAGSLLLLLLLLLLFLVLLMLLLLLAGLVPL